MMSWKIIWKVWKPFIPEAKMSIMSILFPLFILRLKRKDPFSHSLISNLIEKGLVLSRLTLDSELHSLSLTVSNSRQKPLLLILGESISALTMSGKILIYNMEITSQDFPILILLFSKTLMKKVILLILAWEKLKMT